MFKYLQFIVLYILIGIIVIICLFISLIAWDIEYLDQSMKLVEYNHKSLK